MSSKIHMMKDVAKDVATDVVPAPLIEAAAYVRVSTEEQGDKYGPDFQRHEIIRYAEYHGYRVLPEHVYMDIGYSGATSIEEREGLKSLWEAAERKEFSTVLVWKVDRLFRRLLYLLDALDRLSKLGIGFVATTQPEMNTTSSIGKVIMAVIGILSEVERDNILERTAAGRQAAARAGKWAGGRYPPYGYDIDPATRIMSVNDEEANIVRKIFDWLVRDRLTTYAIQKRINAMKVRTKADSAVKSLRDQGKEPGYCRTRNAENFWGHSTIIKVLRQDAYKGEYYYNKRKRGKDPATRKMREVINPREKWIPIQCIPIVEKEVWEKAQQILADNQKHARRNRQHDYLFAGGIVVCGVCGSNYECYMKKKYKRSGGGRVCVDQFPQCRCRKISLTKASTRCTNRHISERILEDRVWKQIHSLLADPRHFLDRLQQREERKGNAQELRVKLREIDAELAEAQKEWDRVLDLYERGIRYQNPGELPERQRQIQAQKQVITVERNAIAGKLLSQEEKRDRAKLASLLAKRYRSSLEDLSPKERARLIRDVVRRIVVYPRKIHIEYRLSRSLFEKTQKGEDGGGGDQLPPPRHHYYQTLTTPPVPADTSLSSCRPHNRAILW